MHRMHLLRLIIIAVLALAGCDSFQGEKLFSWSDAEKTVQVEVRLQMYGGRNRVHMQVVRDGNAKQLVLADRVEMKRASLVRYNDWLLVLSGPYVLGGYDLYNNKMATMNSAALPFTYRDQSGLVVDEIVLQEGEDEPPFNFQARKDPRM